MSAFLFVAALVLVCRHFGMSVFRFVDVSVCRRFDQLPTKGSTLTHQILFLNMVISEWISSVTFFIISLSLSFTSLI